jgi:hypothetical protein
MFFFRGLAQKKKKKKKKILPFTVFLYAFLTKQNGKAGGGGRV